MFFPRGPPGLPGFVSLRRLIFCSGWGPLPEGYYCFRVFSDESCHKHLADCKYQFHGGSECGVYVFSLPNCSLTLAASKSIFWFIILFPLSRIFYIPILNLCQAVD
jgi:hypothetical protein